MLDFPASGYALLALSEQSGLRAEYVVPVLELESGLNPALPNMQGLPYYGLNQISGSYLAGRGITPSQYLSWPASSQLSAVVSSYFRAQVAAYGPIRSAARLYQANLLPSTLATANTLDSVLAQRGSQRLIPHSQLTEAAVYAANSGLDADGSGTITVGDLAAKMRQMLARPAVQSAIAQTYALRPGESPVADPALGDDFSTSGAPGAWTRTDTVLVVGAAVGIGVAVLAATGVLDAPVRALRRAVLA